MQPNEITQLILDALTNINLSRPPSDQLQVSPDAVIFGPGSPLDSMGLVALLIDIEEAFQARGISLTLSDERAMSQSRSPFRSVPRLAAYIASVLAQPA